MTNILDTLNPIQKELLDQFQTITKSNAIQASIAILETHNWNLEHSIQSFYESGFTQQQDEESRKTSSPPPRPAKSPLSSTNASSSSSSSTRESASPSIRNRLGIMTLFMWPFGLAWNLVWALLSFANRMISRRSITSSQVSSTANTGHQRQDPRSSANRFLRDFEKLYGDTHVEFSQEGYTRTLEKARHELKFLLVVLQCDEHDDNELFCRNTLTDHDLMDFIRSKDILVWGGNVAQVEAYQVSCTLQATTYPFMAVIALQSGSSRSAPKMSVVDRLEGLISSANLIQRLDATLQRYGTVMNRMKMERDQREMERRLREDQDMAYQESLKTDREKERKMQVEQQLLNKEKEERNRARLELEIYVKNRQQYIQSLCHALPEEPASDYEGKVTKLNFRLANGDRVIRKFKESDSIETLYQFVEVYPLLKEGKASSSEPVAPPLNYQHKYGFTLLSPFPRTVYEISELQHKSLLDVPSLWPSATLIVETLGEDVDGVLDDNRHNI
ncbi:hypothetical protein BCR42DRAFT_417592, partial [Absidia repens]